MKQTILLCNVILFIFISINLTAGGRADKDTESENFIEGILSLTGNEPHTELILRTEDRNTYRLTGDSIFELRKEGIGKKVRLYGELQGRCEKTFGPDVFLVSRWEFL